MPAMLVALLTIVGQEPRPLAALAPVHPIRLALTPSLDGVGAEGEWDLLYDSGPSRAYMQWEPGTLYFALSTLPGHDLVVSLDHGADGWLVGDDNVELRFRRTPGGVEASARRLDATDPAGPVWIASDVPEESVRAAVGDSGAGTMFEVALIPPRSHAPRPGTRIGVRMDAVPTGADLGPAYLPRPVTFLRLETEVGMGLPPGFSWRPSLPSRTLAVEDDFRARIVMQRESGDVAFETIRAGLEGSWAPAMATSEGPFPTWSAKNGAVFDYATTVARGSEPGYRVFRVEAHAPGQPAAVFRTSIRIAPLVDLELDMPDALPYKDDAQVVRGRVVVKSNAKGKVSGTVSLSCPPDWSVTKGKEARYLIYHPRGTAKVPFELVVPKGEVSTGRIVVETKIGERTITHEVFLPVGG